MVCQPWLPLPVEEEFSGDVIEVGIVEADDCPDILEEALAVVDAGVRHHAGELVEGITQILQVAEGFGTTVHSSDLVKVWVSSDDNQHSAQ